MLLIREDDKPPDLSRNPVVRWVRHCLPVSAEFDQDVVEFVIVLDVFRALFAGDEVEWRLGDVEESALHEERHVAAEKREKQGADVRTVHVGIGHDDDFVVADFIDVE